MDKLNIDLERVKTMADIENKLGNAISCGNKDEKNRFIKLFREAITAKGGSPLMKFSDLKDGFKYCEDTGMRFGFHNGQRKLLLAEMAVLNKFMKKRGLKHGDFAWVIYAGSAPGNKSYILHELYPGFKFIFVDPNPFEIRITGDDGKEYIHTDRGTKYSAQFSYIKTDEIAAKIDKDAETVYYLISDYYTQKTSEYLTTALSGKNAANVCFISDIRTNISDEGPVDKDIIWNDCQQLIWIIGLKDVLNMFSIKFRQTFYLPQYDTKSPDDFYIQPYKDDLLAAKELTGIDFVQNYLDRKLVYIRGDIYLQQWEGMSSSETRIIGEIDGGKIEFAEYPSYLEYEEKINLYNRLHRTFCFFDNKYSNAEFGFDHCNDCAAEAAVYEEYLDVCECREKDKAAFVTEMLAKIQKITKRNLFYQSHGHFFERFDEAALVKFINISLEHARNYINKGINKQHQKKRESDKKKREERRQKEINVKGGGPSAKREFIRIAEKRNEKKNSTEAAKILHELKKFV